MLFDLNRENGTALVLVTHDLSLAARAGRVVSMHAGRIVMDEPAPSVLLRVGSLPNVKSL